MLVRLGQVTQDRLTSFDQIEKAGQASQDRIISLGNIEKVSKVTGCIKKNVPLCFLYILAPIKATEMFFIWEDRGNPAVRFEYKTNSEP